MREHLEIARAHRETQPDLARALGDRHERDVHDGDPAYEQGHRQDQFAVQALVDRVHARHGREAGARQIEITTSIEAGEDMLRGRLRSARAGAAESRGQRRFRPRATTKGAVFELRLPTRG